MQSNSRYPDLAREWRAVVSYRSITVGGKTKMRSVILSAFFIPFLVANVHAEDLNSAPAPDWAGAYLGVQGGFASGKSLGGGYFLLAPGSDVVGDLDPAGFTGGIHAGYNFQRDTPVVIGIEGDIEYAHIRGSSDLSFNGVPIPSNEMSSEMNWRGSVRARAENGSPPG